MKNFRFNQMCRMSGMLMGAASVGNDTAKRRQRDGLENQGHSSVGLTKLLFTITLLLTLGVGQMWANGAIGYKGVKFTKNGAATGWYNIHNVSWNYSDASYECRSGESGVTDFNNADLGTVTALKLKAFVVIGWTDNSDYVAGQLKYRLYKQGASAPSYSTYNVGKYGANTSGAADVLVSSGNDRVVGQTSITTDIVTSSTAAGNYYLQLQGMGRLQYNGGSWATNDGSAVKATLLVPGFTTMSTSNAFGNVSVGSNTSTTISFTQHYGTALTTSNCSLTNSTDFAVTGISETGVTVKFMPQSTGDKSSTLTITDANSKTCTITLTGTGTSASTATITYHENFRTETGNGTGSAPDEEVYALNATATVAGQNTMSWSYYTFSGWNTSQYITGDHYDEDDEFEITEDMDLYATWTRSIPMENEDATTNVSTTVYGTYNSTALTTHTNPAKTGYTFGGWWTQIAGGGNYVISPGHVLQASKTNWTDGSGRFIRPSTSTSSLYAKWTQDITLNANTSNHGSGSNTTAAVTYKNTALTSITHCTPAAGYKVEGYYTAATDGTKILNADGTFAGSNITVSGDVYIASSQWKHAGATTLYAHYEPKTTVRLYYSNPDNWSTVKAYVWCNANTSDKNAAWSGVEITSNTLVRNGDTYYYYEYYKEDHPNWDRVIFNDGSNQTNNITFSNTTNNGQYNDAKKSEVGSWQDLPAEETVYSVTFYAGNRGAISAKGTAVAKNGNASVNIGATPRALTVTSVDNGYSFDYWETSGSVTVADIYSESTTVSASGTGTVTAHYLANSGWYLHGNVDGATDWCAKDYWPHRWPIDRPYRGVSGVYYRKISSINNGAYFGIHDGSNKYSGNNSESDYSWNGSFHDLVVNTGHCFQASTAFSDKWVVINTSSSPKKIWIQSPTTYYTVTVSSDHGTVKLKEKSYGGLETVKFASGETIRVEIDTVAHYSIKSVKLGDTNVTMTHSSGTKFTGDVVMPASNATLTVTYTPWYQITLAASPAAAADAPTAAKTTGGASVANNSYVLDGTSVTFTYDDTPNTGYSWGHWENNDTNVGTGSTYVTTIYETTAIKAVYTENEYDVAVSAGSNGSVSLSGTVAVKQVSGTSLTATANDGYHFVDWTISGGGITPGTSSTSSQTFKATEDGGSIQANFAENMHTVTVASNNTAFGTVSTSSVSAGIATASSTLTATHETGATFTGWTIPSGVTVVSPATSSSTSITIRATADSKTITANFTEDMNTVTLTNQNSTYGDVNTSSPQNVGQITAVQIRATPKSGYMFAGWVKRDGTGTVTYHTVSGTGAAVDPTGNTQATTYITVDGNVTLQATWEEDRSSGWFMRGVWDDGWSEDGEKPFIKNVGETEGTVSHVRWTLDPRNFTNAILEMKVYDGSNYWAHWSTLDASENLCTKASNNSNIGFYQDDNNKNFRISIEVYGEYDFEWDSSTKQLTVHYPTGNFIRGDFNSWGWEDLLTATGTANEYAGSIHLAANQTWTAGGTGFKAVILGDHYGKDGTTITRANHSADELSRSGANIGLTTDVAGDYTFTINTSSKNLSVTYPTAYTVTFGYGVGGSAVTASATSRAGSFASGGYVASGDDITFTQTPAAGYTFKGWYTTADGNTEVSTMGESDNVLNGLSGIATVYAQYTPTTYTNVTLNATTGSTNGAYSVTFGGTSITVTTDPLKTGYEPEGFYESYANGIWTNKIAASDGTLQSGTTYTDATGHWTATNRPTLYTKWQPKTYAIELNMNGSYVDNGSATATYDNNTLTGITAPQRTGYSVEGYYKEVGYTNLVASPEGALEANVDGYTGAGGIWQKDATATLYANWTANNYDVILDVNGATSGSNQTVEATFDDGMPTTQKTSGDAITAPSKTGYTFGGYWTNTNGTGTQYYTDALANNHVWDVANNEQHIYAKWTANPYVVTLDIEEDNHGTIADKTTRQDVTYDAATTTVPALPTAANGYRLVGYYTGQNGAGIKLINGDGTWIASVDDYTDEDKKWVHVGDVTLYAYYKKAEITGITFTDGAVVAPNTSKTVTATIDPDPTGTMTVCWRVLYSNDNQMDPQPAFSPVTAQGNSVSFTAPESSGIYKMEAVLHLGSGCGGEEWSTYVANFQVAGDHIVTIQYKDAEGNTLQDAGSVTGKPLEWSAEKITAPDIFGYTFARWEAGDGVTISTDAEDPIDGTSTTTEEIYIKAVYDGTLKAVYNQNQMIYFKNTLGWSDVYVNFHTGNAWNNENNPHGSPKGVGNSGLTNANKHMTRIGDTDVWYYDYGYNSGGSSISPSLYISFTDQSRPSASEFWDANPGINVVYPANYADALSTDKSSENGFKAATPMFVPLSGVAPAEANVGGGGKANYYNRGYWTTYTAGTGYTLEIYYDLDESSCIQSIPFTSADDLMPMKAVVDLEAGQTYRYQVRRGGTESAGVYYGNSNTMTYTNHGGSTGTDWEMTNGMSPFKKAKITANAAGNYTFNLSYSPNASNEYRLRIGVDYPVASGDYLLVYNDDVQDKEFKSAVIPRAKDKDTVSFFVRKGQHAILKLKKCTGLAEGSVTWSDSTTLWDGTSLPEAITKDSVYNICLKHKATGELEIENVEGYTGNFYIRTNAAGASKWDNYRSADHLMTYSPYSEANADYSHYFMAYVGDGTNVKFVVANDYSPCISDTLVRQTYRGGDSYHVDEDGDIGADANVRFMWNKNNNEVYRAYLAAAKSDGSKFLVLRANSSTDLMDENGNALLNSANSGQAGYNHKAPDNQMQFIDDDNWIYETTVKVKPDAYVKLYAYFNTKYFYYKGNNNDNFNETVVDGTPNAIQLMTGTGEAEKLHVIYDFKTDRLMAAWMPSGNIDTEREINADVMFVREHQGDIEQLTFSENAVTGNMGSITAIKTAYGVLRFNKWTLNNKSTEAGHAVLDPLLSRYERDLFYVSFPFRVSMEEVFGFGKYGQHWIIEEYDGEGRAANGFWADTPTYWRFITNRKGKFFEPNQGYIIALDLDELGESSSVWDNGVEQVELYFPSYEMGDITNSEVEYTLPAHTYDPAAHPTHSDDRSIADSHWNVMSVPTYVNTSNVSFANTTWTATRPNYLYEWNMDDNTLTPRSGSGYKYHAMHAYMVQYAGKVTWTSTSVTPASVVARERTAPKEVEYRLELSQNDKMVDQAFVKMSNDEEVSAGFVFGEDMSKEFNKNKANIYTMVSTMIDGDLSITETAGNTLPMSEQTTVVPVGVKIATTGDYTFAIPEGTNGVGVTLIDNETGIRTSLSALDYTVNLNAGTYNERFVLEISPVAQTPTGVENGEWQNGDGARKVLIDNHVYIIRGDKMYDATGALVNGK